LWVYFAISLKNSSVASYFFNKSASF
jgi:hypothetical protein